MAELTPLERVKAYYRDLNTGNSERVARHFQPSAHHYYTRIPTNERSPRRAG